MIQKDCSSLAVFIPTYNEAETIGALIERIPRRFNHRDVDIYVVDDCSTDATAECARDAGARVRVMEENSGVGATTKYGLSWILSMNHHRYIVKIDGDGQHEPEMIALVFECLLKGGRELVTCSRFHPNSDQRNTPLDRILLNRLFADVISDLTGWSITDARTGFMGFTSRVLKEIVPHMIVRGYGVPMEILLRAHHAFPLLPHFELSHPARYDVKVDTKYAIETYAEKGHRLSVAFQSLLTVLNDLGVDANRLALRPGNINTPLRSGELSVMSLHGRVHDNTTGAL